MGVIRQREVKEECEIAEIEKAINWSVDMHESAMRMARPGMLEAEIAAAVTRIPLAKQGYLAFPVIATIRGAVLHNHYHGNMLKEGDLFLLDAGAESTLHYASDLTSTFPVSKKFTGIQRAIYQIVLDAHQRAAAMLKPGIKFRHIHLKTSRIIFDGLKSLGLVKGDSADAVDKGAHALFFPHGLGHIMGLDVHDMEDLGEIKVGYSGRPRSKKIGLRSLRFAKKLKPGFVMTIEPGIYFIPELIAQWKKERRLEQFIKYSEVEKLVSFGGIRLEQDYLVTKDSARLLGRKKPMEIDEVEKLRRA